MPGFLSKLKAKLSRKGKKGKKGEAAPAAEPEVAAAAAASEDQQVSIQPHPAKSNDPADLNPPQPGGGMRHDGGMEAHHARDPHVPAPEVLSSLPEPATHEELQARQAELNK
ncbi:hypothetical protein EV122DRAFT_283040 [Schizophyllum commune]